MAKTIGYLETEKALLQKLTEIRKDRATMHKRGNAWTAVGQMHKLESDLLEKLSIIRAPKPTVQTGDGMSDDELVEGVCRMVRELPDDAFERLWEVVEARRLGRPDLRVVEEA